MQYLQGLRVWDLGFGAFGYPAIPSLRATTIRVIILARLG